MSQVRFQILKPEHETSGKIHKVSGLDLLYADLGNDHFHSLDNPEAGSPDPFLEGSSPAEFVDENDAK